MDMWIKLALYLTYPQRHRQLQTLLFLSDFGPIQRGHFHEIRQILDEIFADRAYYDHEGAQALIDQGIIPVILPPKTAVVQVKPETNWHNFLASCIQRKGAIYAFHQEFSYGRRERIEAHFSWIIRCLGNGFKTIKLDPKKWKPTLSPTFLTFELLR